MRPLPCLLLGLMLTVAGSSARGGDRASALQALQALQTRVGAAACEVLMAVHGQQGQDQPLEWIILAVNGQSPNLGQQYVVGQSGVVDEGVPEGLYPSELPPGFLRRSEVLVDSPYAFQTLHQAALRAQVAFNAVNYTLVARDYGSEPVWRLEALDAKGRTVGQLDLSGKSGTILRSVWYYWDDASTGAAFQGPRIVDSLLPESSVQPVTLNAGIGAQPPVEVPAPRAEPVRQTEAKEKGGLFSRLRRNTRPLFGSPASATPVPAPPEPAPEAGVAVPVPAGGASSPMVEVAPVVPGTATPPVPPAGSGTPESLTVPVPPALSTPVR